MIKNVISLVKEQKIENLFKFYTGILYIILFIVCVFDYMFVQTLHEKNCDEDSIQLDYIQLQTNVGWTIILGLYTAQNFIKPEFITNAFSLIVHAVSMSIVLYYKILFTINSSFIYNDSNKQCVFFISKNFNYFGMFWDVTFLIISIVFSYLLLNNKCKNE